MKEHLPEASNEQDVEWASAFSTTEDDSNNLTIEDFKEIMASEFDCRHVHPNGQSAVVGKWSDKGMVGQCAICGECVYD